MVWAPDYATLAEGRNYLRITDDADTVDDTLISQWITTASRMLDDHCGRQFGKTDAPEERSFSPVWRRDLCRYVVDLDDLPSADGLVVMQAGTTLEVTDYRLEPANAPTRGRPYERMIVSGGRDVDITAPVWGWSAVPAAAKTAVLLQMARLEARRDSPWGIAGSPSEGSEVRLLSKLDPDAALAAKQLRRRWWAA